MKKHLFLLLAVCIFAFISCSDDKDKTTVYELNVDKTTVTFAADGTSDDSKLIITSNTAWQIVVPKGAEWFQLSKIEGEGNAVIEIDMDENYSGALQRADITIKSPEGLFTSQTVGIRQVGLDLNFDILSKIKDEALRDYCKRFDFNKDGRVSPDEAKLVVEIVCASSDVKSLAGIEYFTELKTLDFSHCDVSELDVSKNIKLTRLACYSSLISELDVSKNIALEELICYQTKISKLDLSKNEALKYLSCSQIGISELDISKNIALENLNCNQTKISELDLSKNTNLQSLDCTKTSISELDISKNINLTWLDCSNTAISELDTSNNIELYYLYCSDVPISKLDISNNTNLYNLNCFGTAILELDISKSPNIYDFKCQNNPNLSVVYVWDGFDVEHPKETIPFSQYDPHTIFEVKK